MEGLDQKNDLENEINDRNKDRGITRKKERHVKQQTIAHLIISMLRPEAFTSAFIKLKACLEKNRS